MILEYPKLPSSLLKLKNSTVKTPDNSDDKKSETSTVSGTPQQNVTVTDRSYSSKVDDNSLSSTSSVVALDDVEVGISLFFDVN